MSDTTKLIQMFNEIAIKEYADKRGESPIQYSAQKINEILSSPVGPIAIGAIYRWPTSSGNKTYVTGFGLAKLEEKLWFLAAFNSKKLGRPRMEKLYPEEVLKMIESGDVEYLGNIFDLEFRRNFDYEKITLSIMGFASLALTSKLQKDVSIDSLIEDLDNGKMTIDQLLEKCRGISGPQLIY